MRLADVAYLYDAVDAQAGGPQLAAVCSAGTSTALTQPLPAWAQAMLAG